MPHSPSEKIILDIRDALGCVYDQEEDAKVLRQLKDAATWGTGLLTAGIGALFASGVVPKTQLLAPVVLSLFLFPMVPQILFFMASCMVLSATPKQRETVARVHFPPSFRGIPCWIEVHSQSHMRCVIAVSHCSGHWDRHPIGLSKGKLADLRQAIPRLWSHAPH